MPVQNGEHTGANGEPARDGASPEQGTGNAPLFTRHEPNATPASTPEPHTAPAASDEPTVHTPLDSVTPDVAEQAYTERPEPGMITASEPTSAPDAAAIQYPAAATADTGGWPLTYAPSAKPIYVQAPTPPAHKGNRGFGILVSVIATVVFALVYGGVIGLITTLETGSVDVVGGIIRRVPFWLPIIVFFLAMVLLVAIVNRGGWWAYVLGSFFVAALTYGGYVGGFLIEQANALTPDQAGPFVLSILLTPPAAVAFVVAREVPTWFGAWIAARGRKVRERNDEAQREYERMLEQGPVV